MAENFTIEANDEVENFEVDFGEVTRVSNNDFNILENRPSYAGEVMTGETSIPEVPSAVSELANDANYQTGAQVATAIGAETTARENADTALDNRLTTVEGIAGTALQPEAINKVVMTDIAVGANTSTTTFNLEAAKENLLTGATSSKQVSMPVASSTEAGIMNSSTFDAVSNNTSNINALLNGAVAITGLPAEPTQAQLTTAWETATGATALMNRAGIYDVTNGKVWTYYTNSATWYSVTNTTQVTINTFTNNSEGTIKGSTNVGQIFAETDGTGSVNGWDALNDAVSNNTSDIADLETAVDGKQDKLIAGANINIASDGKTISATDTTYTAGNGINISAQNVISTDAPEGFFTLPATVEGEGSEITLNNTIGAKLDGMQIDGDTYQQTYDGKNLFNKSMAPTVIGGGTNTVTETATGVRITLNTAGTYSFRGWIVGKVSDYLNKTLTLSANVSKSADGVSPNMYLGYCNDVGGTRKSVASASGEGEKSCSTQITEVDADGREYIIVALYGTEGRDTSIDDYSQYDDVQLQIGEKTAYEPYVGGVPAPNPDYPQDIDMVTGEQTVVINGGNQFDYSKAIPGYYTATGVYQNRDNNYTSDFIPTNGDSVILAECSTIVNYIGINEFDANKNFIKRSQTLQNRSSSLQVTSDSNTRYVRVAINKDGTSMTQESLADVQAGVYLRNNYPISLGSTELCKIGDYQDYIYKSGDDWYVHKETGKVIYNGSETWYFDGSHPRASVARPSEMGSTYQDQATTTKCTHFVAGNTASANNVYNIGSTYDYFKASSIMTSLDNWKTWLSNNNMSFYYKLATPTDTQITDATLVGQLEALWNAMSYNGQTNFVVTASDSGALSAILEVKAYQKSLNGLLGAIERVNE